MREDIVSVDDDGMMDTKSADAANPKLTSSGLLHLTAKIAAEIYVGRAGEPVGPRNAQRTYEIHDAVNEAAALLTVALTPSLAAESYRIAAATYGVPSLLDAVAASETVG
ncbi:hypothetical protein AAII07_48190 [Microvirga sp. 0TCS3.31]